MLAWNISEGSRVNKLSGPWPMLLYTWLIAHADNLGRFHGEPEQVKALVLPRRRDVTIAEIEEWLLELSLIGLIYWFEVDGMKYIEFPEKDWTRHQRLHGNMRKTSDLPRCPGNVRTAYKLTTHTVSPEVEVEVEGEVEVEEEREREVEAEGEGESREEGAAAKPSPRRPHVNPVRTRTGKPVNGHPDPGPAFWNDPAIQSKMDRLSALSISFDEARRLVLTEAKAEGRLR